MYSYHKWFSKSGSHKLTACNLMYYTYMVRIYFNIVFSYTGYCICPNRILFCPAWILYLSEINMVFVLNLYCIRHNWISFLMLLCIVFVLTDQSTCPNCILYFHLARRCFVWYINSTHFHSVRLSIQGGAFLKISLLLFVPYVIIGFFLW